MVDFTSPKLSNATFNNVGGAVNDIFQGQATASSLRLKAQGNELEGVNYRSAAELAKSNEEFTRQSTEVQEAAATRSFFKAQGATENAVAGAGFANSGSALDIMRSNAQQGALQTQLIGQQGLMTEAGFEEQQQAYTRLAGYADMSAATEREQADKAESNSYITAGIKGAAAVASLFI